MKLKLNDEAKKEELHLYQIFEFNIKEHTVPLPEPSGDLNQQIIFIFVNQNLVLLVPNDNNSHLFHIEQLPLQQPVENVLHN